MSRLSIHHLAGRHSAWYEQAVEQYEAVKEKEREQVAELEEVRTAVKEATTRFQQLKQERHSLFMTAFQHVADTINTVYTVRCPIPYTSRLLHMWCA